MGTTLRQIRKKKDLTISPKKDQFVCDAKITVYVKRGQMHFMVVTAGTFRTFYCKYM